MEQPTVKIGKDQHVWAFSADMVPIVRVDPGTVLESKRGIVSLDKFKVRAIRSRS